MNKISAYRNVLIEGHCLPNASEHVLMVYFKQRETKNVAFIRFKTNVQRLEIGSSFLYKQTLEAIMLAFPLI